VAGSSFFALLDDIASILDDVAAMTKVATKKTAGVLGDDLALNAQQVTGVNSDRELPVVWAVAKGSLVNKAILVPGALVLAAFAEWAINPLLMFGGLFLCFEGVEKLAHKFLHSEKEDEAHHEEHLKAVLDENVDMVAYEKEKIKGAVRTDFVLSAEIVVISLNSATEGGKPFSNVVLTLVAISLIMTVGVYGLVAGIVKLDDAGLKLTQKGGGAAVLGRMLLAGAPLLLKFLSVAGTAAMFLVGGSILTHGIGPVHHLFEEWTQKVAEIPVVSFVVPSVLDGVFGVLAGIAALILFMGGSAAYKKVMGKAAE
jgi:predicted DNA repair protein MutK